MTLSRAARSAQLAFKALIAGIASGREAHPDALVRARLMVLELAFLLASARQGALPPPPESSAPREMRRWLERAAAVLPDDTPMTGDLLELPEGRLEALWRRIQEGGTTAPSALHEALQGVRIPELAQRGEAGRKRRARGCYYTPPALAAFIVREALPIDADLEADGLQSMRVLDPAAGAGVFLREAAQRLGGALAVRTRLPLAEAIAQVVSECLYGVDIDLEATTVARWELLLLGAGPAGFPRLGDHVRRADALVGAEPEHLPWPVAPASGIDRLAADAFTAMALHPELDWPPVAHPAAAWLEAVGARRLEPVVQQLAGSEGYLHWALSMAPARDGGFHAVVGNPPYLSALRGGAEQFARLKASPRTAGDYQAKGDLFYHFLALGARLLRPAGLLGMIVPPYWRVRTNARRLRDEIDATCRVRLRVEFGESRPFREAPGHHSEILVLERSTATVPGVLFRVIDARMGPDEAAALLARGEAVPGRLERSALEQPGAAGEESPDRRAASIEVGPPPADASRAPVFTLDPRDVCQGLVMPQSTLSRAGLERLPPGTARVGDGIFWLRDAELKALELSPAERALVGPYLPVGSVWPFYAGKPEGWVLYLDGKAEAALRTRPDRYPRLIAHLLRFAPAITSSHGPFGLHRARQRPWFEAPGRILVVRKTPVVKAARVSGFRLVDQGFNVIRPTGEDQAAYLLGILHSAWATRWLRRSKSMGQLLQIDKDVLCALPFPRVVPPPDATRGEVARVLAELGPEGVVAQVSAAGPVVARAGVEALVAGLEARAAMRWGAGAVDARVRTARPGRGGRFHLGAAGPDPEWERLQAALDAVVETLYETA